MKKICFITTTRADYGLIQPVMKKIQTHPGFELQIIAAAAHYADITGNTYTEIEQDGFTITQACPSLVITNNDVDVPATAAKTTQMVSTSLQKLNPDLVVIVGDRYEMLGAATAVFLNRIPMAHLYGGDITTGAYDDQIRHAITHMAHLHFTTNDESRNRVIQLGEHPDRVFNFGAPSLDKIRNFQPMSKNDLEQELGFKFGHTNLLITFHPVTMQGGTSVDQLNQLLGALDKNHTLIFTMPNVDHEGLAVREATQKFIDQHPNAFGFNSLGHYRYFSLMSHVDMVVGNSSSGIYETPSFKIPTVNIGTRQDGRLRAASVIDCDPEKSAIATAIKHAQTLDCTKVKNPYDAEINTADAMIKILEQQGDFSPLLQKQFYEKKK